MSDWKSGKLIGCQMNCSCKITGQCKWSLITKHQSLKMSAFSLFLLVIFFFRSVKFPHWKISATCRVRGHQEKCFSKIKEFDDDTVLFHIHQRNGSSQISRTTHRFYILYWKRKDFLRKHVRVFKLLRSINISPLPRGMCQLKKPPAHEITEPLREIYSI